MSIGEEGRMRVLLARITLAVLFPSRRKRRWNRSVPLTTHPMFVRYRLGEMDECGATLTDEQIADEFGDQAHDARGDER